LSWHKAQHDPLRIDAAELRQYAQNGAYVPELDLVYWGTGNAKPYNPEYRGD
jgi:hypothetical protein